MGSNQTNVAHLREDILQEAPQAFHSALVLQVLDHAVPVKIEDAQRPTCGPRPPHPAQPIRKILRQQQLVLPL